MRTVFILMFATLYAGMFAVQGNAQPEEKQKVAVYVTGGTNDNINKVIGSKLVQAIIKNGKYSAVERTDAIIAMLRKEQNYQRSGNVDDNQIGRMGKELGVNFVCVAEVVEAFGAKYISARLVDADRMEAVEFADVDGNMNDMTSLVKMSETVAARLLGGGIEAAPSDNVNKAPQNSSDTPSQDGEKTPSPNSGKTVDNGAAWNPDGIDMVYVAGTGSGILAQNGFYIGKYEVTQAQWQAIMGSNPSGFAGCSDCPVENISWDDVKNFIGKLNSKTGRNYRLPTEKEWEYAAQGGANPKNIYEYAGGNSCGKVAWHSNNSNKRTHPVGSKKPNPLGIYDMSGNVLEWCENHFDDNSPFRVIRGGSWNNDAEDCRIVNRYGTSPGDRGGNVGFRLVLSE